MFPAPLPLKRFPPSGAKFESEEQRCQRPLDNPPTEIPQSVSRGSRWSRSGGGTGGTDLTVGSAIFELWVVL